MRKNLLALRVTGMIMPAGCLILLLALSGCATSGPKRLDSPAITEMNDQVQETQKYVLFPGDLICIRFLYSPELNEDELIIGPDGNISLQLVGEMQAAGLTLPELNTALTEKYYNVLGYSLDEYSLGIGDVISIKLLYNHELNSDAKVRPDGKISLPLVGEITTAGLTPVELQTFLTDQYARKLDPEETPEVTVIVQDFKVPELNVSLLASASHIAYIGGEVNHPKTVDITRPIKMLNALTMAGGTTSNAKLESVVLLRHNETDTADAYLLNMNKVIEGKMPDIKLKPYDIVYVPKTSMAEADLFMQHIWHMLPTNILFSFPYNLNPDTEIKVKD